MWKIKYFKITCKSELTEKITSVFNVSKNVNELNTLDQLQKCEKITLKTEWESLMEFQIDNGSAVNILPLSIYETISKDYKHT